MSLRALPRRLGRAALAGMLVFVVVAVLVQCLRRDLSWTDAPLSLYLLDRYGHWLQAAYAVLAASLVMLGTGYYMVLPRQARSMAPGLLFVSAAVALCVTALAHSNLHDRAPTLEGWVHGTADRPRSCA